MDRYTKWKAVKVVKQNGEVVYHVIRIDRNTGKTQPLMEHGKGHGKTAEYAKRVLADDAARYLNGKENEE